MQYGRFAEACAFIRYVPKARVLTHILFLYDEPTCISVWLWLLPELHVTHLQCIPNGISLNCHFWTNPFRIKGFLGGTCYFQFHSNSAASDGVLHCFPMSH